MKRFHICARMLLLMIVLAVIATGGQATQTAKPVREMERLGFLLGDWTFTDQYVPRGEGAGTAMAQPGPGRHSIRLESHTEGSLGSVEAMQIIFWDPKTAAYTLYWFDNATQGNFVASGRWEGEELVFTGEVEGILYRTVYRDIAAGLHTIALYKRMPGADPRLSMTTRMKRK